MYVKGELLKPRITDETKSTIIDNLRDKITSIIIDEKLLSEQQQHDAHTIQLLRARLEQLESQLVVQGERLSSVEKAEHQEHVLFEHALNDIEDELARPAENRKRVKTRGKDLDEAVRGQDVRRKKIEQITAALRRVEREHERLARKKNVDQEHLTRLARMIRRHKVALENI